MSISPAWVIAIAAWAATICIGWGVCSTGQPNAIRNMAVKSSPMIERGCQGRLNWVEANPSLARFNSGEVRTMGNASWLEAIQSARMTKPVRTCRSAALILRRSWGSTVRIPVTFAMASRISS